MSGWAVFRKIGGMETRVTYVMVKREAEDFLKFDDCVLSYLRADGIDPAEFYIKPVDMKPGTP